MPRAIMLCLLALALCLGLVATLLAAEGTVVAPPEKGVIEVKFGDKAVKIDLKGVKVFDAEGKALKGKEAAATLKKDSRVDVKKEGDKVVEIKILK